jgi:c-di-GMP-related signal transduction protein
MLLGLDVLCDGRRAFINCTREVLLKDYVMLLPANQTIVEVLEDVEPDDLVTGCLGALERSRIHDRARRLRP